MSKKWGKNFVNVLATKKVSGEQSIDQFDSRNKKYSCTHGQKVDKKLILRHKLFKLNGIAVLKVLKKVRQNIVETEEHDKIIENVPIVEFKIPLRKELKSCVNVRLFETSSVPKRIALPMPTNKGKLQDVIDDEENNLI